MIGTISTKISKLSGIIHCNPSQSAERESKCSAAVSPQKKKGAKLGDLDF